jgi:hypothetical protein
MFSYITLHLLQLLEKKNNQRVEVEDGYHSLKQNVTLSHE